MAENEYRKAIRDVSKHLDYITYDFLPIQHDVSRQGRIYLILRFEGDKLVSIDPWVFEDEEIAEAYVEEMNKKYGPVEYHIAPRTIWKKRGGVTK